MGVRWGFGDESTGGGATPQEIETLKRQVGQNTTNISNLESTKADKTTLSSLANVAAKTNITNTFTANQQVNGQVVVAKSAESIVINSSGDKFIAFKNGSTRESYIGRPTSGSSDFEINTGRGNLKINTANKITSNNDIELSAGKGFKGLSITLGFGGTPVIAPDEGTTKPLRFSNGNIRFGSLDFQNQTKLVNVPNIKTVVVENISQNSTKVHNLPAGSVILSIYNNSTGKNNIYFNIKDNGELTITNNNDGVLSSYVVKYWEV